MPAAAAAAAAAEGSASAAGDGSSMSQRRSLSQAARSPGGVCNKGEPDDQQQQRLQHPSRKPKVRAW
jgi:hypothetical protein